MIRFERHRHRICYHQEKKKKKKILTARLRYKMELVHSLKKQ